MKIFATQYSVRSYATYAHTLYAYYVCIVCMHIIICEGVGGNGKFGHICVIEKNGFEVLISDRREVGAGDIKGEGTGGFQEGRVSMRGGADTSGHPLGESY